MVHLFTCQNKFCRNNNTHLNVIYGVLELYFMKCYMDILHGQVRVLLIFYKILKTFFFIEKTFQIFPSPRCSYPSLTLSERCKDQFANGTQGSNQQWKSTNAQNGIANLFIGYFCPAPKAIFFVVDWEL